MFTSEFGDDFDAIPMYEQIYALAGPTQTYRVTGDPRILSDIERRSSLFDRFYMDQRARAATSRTSTRSRSTRGPSRSGATGQEELELGRRPRPGLPDQPVPGHRRARSTPTSSTYTADTIAKYFPDYDNSPFVQERFFEDWSHDQSWGWQQNRAVVGHNLKIAWNLMRIQHARAQARSTWRWRRKIAEH